MAQVRHLVTPPGKQPVEFFAPEDANDGEIRQLASAALAKAYPSDSFVTPILDQSTRDAVYGKEQSPGKLTQDEILAQQGELTSRDPTMRERATEGLTSVLSGLGFSEGREKAGRLADDVFDWTPAAALESGEEAIRDVGGGRYLDAAGNALLAGLDVIPEVGQGASALAMFLGRNAKTANLDMLRKAEQMTEQGLPRDRILRETGWFNQHGDWKYEIPDTGLKLNPENLPKFGEKVPLRNVVSHPELEAAYPEAWQALKFKKENSPTANGTWIPAQGTVQSKYLSDDDMRSTVGHELQHFVQTQEGFPQGAAPDYSLTQRFSGDEARAVRQEYSDALEERFNRLDADETDPEIPAVERRIQELAARLKQLDIPEREAYQRVAGEAEARNVQRRLNNSDFERQLRTPWNTQDVPDDQQFVIRDGQGPQLSLDPPGTAPVPSALRGYHGSPSNDLASVSASPSARQYDNATSQFGAFFSPNEAGAKRYAGESGKIYQTDLSLQKPYEMPWNEFDYFQSPHKNADGTPAADWAARAEELKQEAAALRAKLADEGHDGLIVKGSRGQPVEIASFNDVPLGADPNPQLSVDPPGTVPAASVLSSLDRPGVASPQPSALVGAESPPAKLSPKAKAETTFQREGLDLGATWSPYGKVKLRQPHGEMTQGIDQYHQFGERPVLRPEDMSGAIIPLVGDRARTGAMLTSVNDTPLSSPVDLQGGPLYPQYHAEKGSPGVWASHPTVTSGIVGHARRVADQFGDVQGVYSAMGPRAVDFNTMTATALLNQLDNSRVTKSALRDFDKDVRKVFPKFAGVSDPANRELLERQLKSNAELRKRFVKRMDLAPRRDAGFPDVAATRYAISEPGLRDMPEGITGTSIAKIDPKMGVISEPWMPHETYSTQIGGEYLGGFEVPLRREEVFPDFFARRRELGVDPYGDRRSFEISNVLQQITPEWQDNLSRLIELRKQRGY
jgi:hypothetical protein